MIRPDLPPAPPAIRALPVDPRGYPIPWFVDVNENGVADFRVIGYDRVGEAIRDRLCWICGQRLGPMNVFVIGPMCAVNRISSEPPSHLKCARWAVTACPFLTRPMAKRNDRDMPDHVPAPGIMIERNPGVALMWSCLDYETFRWRTDVGELFNIGAPVRVQWFAQGRSATREEVLESIATGLPALVEQAEAQGDAAVVELATMLQAVRPLLPAA